MPVIKKIFSLLLRFSISGLLLFILSRKIDYRSTFKVLGTIGPFYLISAAIAFLIIYVVVYYRWKMLLDAQGLHFPPKLLLGSFCGGIFFNLFLPSTIGGDIARSLDLGAHAKSKSIVVASVLLDRLSGFVGLTLLAIVSLIFGHKYITEPSVYVAVFIMAFLLGSLLLILFNERVYGFINSSMRKRQGLKEKLRRLHAEIYFFRSKPAVLYLNFFYSVAIQAGSAFVSYLLLRSLHCDIKIIYPLIFTPLVTLITVLPIAIGGLGLRDASSVFFYAKAGVGKDIALGQSLLNFALIVFVGLIAGILYVSTLHYRRIQPDKAGAAPR
ncbi:flippase-like domain-containing protein [bacterium]|nr:MAG: flippase-like domain-containing protein [bacterium]